MPCSAQRCTADPAPRQVPCLVRSRVCSAPLPCCAAPGTHALRPGHIACVRLSFCDYWSNGWIPISRYSKSPWSLLAMTEQARANTWYDVVLATLKSNNVRLAVYVPDRVFTPLIKALHADAFFTTFAATREEEALGIITGAWMGGIRGAVLMQTSGFGTIPNALASLVVPSQIPALIFVSERGTLGEFNLGQALVLKTMRPVLNSLAVENITITRQDELEFIVDRSIKQAVATQAPVTFILSPLLTGGKVFEG